MFRQQEELMLLNFIYKIKLLNICVVITEETLKFDTIWGLKGCQFWRLLSFREVE